MGFEIVGSRSKPSEDEGASAYTTSLNQHTAVAGYSITLQCDLPAMANIAFFPIPADDAGRARSFLAIAARVKE